MVRIAAVCILLMLPVVAASAQTSPQPSAQPSAQHSPPESVTVTGFKSREVINKFVKSFVAPTAINGKIARWERQICPLTVGQPPAFTNFVTQHVKDIAAAVGAPVNSGALLRAEHPDRLHHHAAGFVGQYRRA